MSNHFSFCEGVCVCFSVLFCLYSFAFTTCPRVLSVRFLNLKIFFFFSIVFSACSHWWICFLVWLLSSFFLSFFFLFLLLFNFFIFNNYFYFNNFILFYFIFFPSFFLFSPFYSELCG